MTEPRYAHVTGWGRYAPAQVLTNADLERMVDTSDEWIRTRTGIRERRVAAAHETTASMGAVAGLRAIRTAGLDPDDIDLILLATLTPDYWMPSTAALVKEAIGNTRAAAMDVAAACSGFVYAFSTAQAYIASGLARHVLVIGSELLTRFLDYTDRSTCILFGDGAGAVVLEAVDASAGSGVLAVRLHAEGKHARRLWLEAPSSAVPGRVTPEMFADRRIYPAMEGRFVFKHAVTRMPEVLLETLDAASVKLAEVDLFLFHQANLRINEAVAQKLDIPPDKVFNNIQQLGNCSAAALPILLSEATREGRLVPGQLVSLTAFGSGFTWASALLRWG